MWRVTIFQLLLHKWRLISVIHRHSFITSVIKCRKEFCKRKRNFRHLITKRVILGDILLKRLDNLQCHLIQLEIKKYWPNKYVSLNISEFVHLSIYRVLLNDIRIFKGVNQHEKIMIRLEFPSECEIQ